MVFQAYSLFPNMTARDNVAYGLRLRGVDEPTRERSGPTRCSSWSASASTAAAIRTSSRAASSSASPSPGRSRSEPKVLLLDEPLSALDAKVRRQLREEIRRIQITVGITTLFVTHDQEEALAMGDRVGVMSAGRLEQIAPPVGAVRPAEDPLRGRVRRARPTASRRRPTTAHVEVLGPASAAPRGLGRLPGPVMALVRPEIGPPRRGPGDEGRVLARELPRLAVPGPGRPCRWQRARRPRCRCPMRPGSTPGDAVRSASRRRPCSRSHASFAVAPTDGASPTEPPRR